MLENWLLGYWIMDIGAWLRTLNQQESQMTQENKTLPDILSVLPVRDSLIFPRMVVPLMVREEPYLKMLDEALQKEKIIAVAMVEQEKGPEEGGIIFKKTGTAVQIIKLSKGEEGTVIAVQGLSRIALTEIVSEEPYHKAKVQVLQDIEHTGRRMDALVSSVLGIFKQILDLSPHLPQELYTMARNIEHPGSLADMMVSALNMDLQRRQGILECLDVKERLTMLSRFLNEELELQKVGRKIQDEVKKGIDKHQREYYLREQLKAIQKELGMDKEVSSEDDDLAERLAKKLLPDAARKVAEKEFQRLSRMQPSSSEYTVSRTYLDWILDLPWLEGTKDNIDVTRAQRILNQHHYNLERVKRRILEYLSVIKLNPQHKGPILCLVGPPGTGKTSLGRSIAEAMGRKFVRISLGGVRDEAEIRGHRRTYVGALPGRIIQGVKKAGSNNPVFMLDEVDKIGTDFRGDPSSALLEVLDPEQNFSFSDHYLELEFDLRQVMFITTANQLDPIPSPLRDRMEVLELSGYTEDEKVRIAKHFLIPRQIEEHGLRPKQVVLGSDGIRKIIRNYTREAGLRNLEREIGAICRGLARRVAEGTDDTFVMTAKAVEEALGKIKFTLDLAGRTSIPGVATGLAWTPSGGDILFVEATMMPGQKSLVLTGQLGDVMKESAQAALSYLRARCKHLGLKEDFYKDLDLHIHIPAGAIPKDGPSAGVTMLTALASLLTSRPVKPRLAMTGEATLRGLVLPVGGIKEKVLAANRSGIRELILPYENRKDLEEIPGKVRSQMAFHFVKRMEEVLQIALEPLKEPPPCPQEPSVS